MAKKEGKNVYVRVKDGVGNEYLCPLEALKDTKEATEEELDNCVDDATVGRYASNIHVQSDQ
jgi:alkaline phosphatase